MKKNQPKTRMVLAEYIAMGKERVKNLSSTSQKKVWEGHIQNWQQQLALLEKRKNSTG